MCAAAWGLELGVAMLDTTHEHDSFLWISVWCKWVHVKVGQHCFDMIYKYVDSMLTCLARNDLNHINKFDFYLT